MVRFGFGLVLVWFCAYDPVLGYDPVLRSGIWSWHLVCAYDPDPGPGPGPGSRLLCSAHGCVLMLTAYSCDMIQLRSWEAKRIANV